MNENQFLKLSKFISLVLRHKPEQIEISLDENGWTNTDKLIEKINKTDRKIDLKILEEIVKKYFLLNSIKIDSEINLNLLENLFNFYQHQLQ